MHILLLVEPRLHEVRGGAFEREAMRGHVELLVRWLVGYRVEPGAPREGSELTVRRG